MKTYKVTVEQEIEVTIDESRFTPEMMANFSEHFYDTPTIENHVERLAEWVARGVIQSADDFHEGYGNLAKEIGFSFETGGPNVWDAEEV